MPHEGLTKKELATLAGYSYRRLHDIDMAMPDSKKLFVRLDSGKYDPALFVQRWVRYNVDNSTDEEQTLDEVKARHELVKKRKTELQVAKMEGSLVDVMEIKRLWGNIANTVMNNLLRMPCAIAPRLVMQKDVEIIASIIDSAVRDTLTQIADTPLPESDAQDDEHNEDEGEEE